MVVNRQTFDGAGEGYTATTTLTCHTFLVFVYLVFLVAKTSPLHESDRGGVFKKRGCKIGLNF